MKAKDFLDLDKQRDRKTLGFYLIWVGLNIFLFILSSDFKYKKSFYPFYTDNGSWEIRIVQYDYSEFLFYTITPIFLFVVYKLIKPVKGE